MSCKRRRYDANFKINVVNLSYEKVEQFIM